MPLCVGIDVAKHSLEWAAGPEGKIQHARNEPRPIGQLVHRLMSLAPERIVIESTGGYERALVAKLAQAGLPVVVVNPRRVRRFGEGMGFLASIEHNLELMVHFETSTSPEIEEFSAIRRDQGLRAALNWRDARFRDL